MILIVDPELQYHEAIKNDPRAKKWPPVFAETGKRAQLLLSDPKNTFKAIFVNPQILEPDAASVIRCAHQTQVNSKLYLLCQKPLPDSVIETYKKLGVDEAVSRTTFYKDMLKKVIPPEELFDADELIQTAEGTGAQKESEGKDQDFISVPLDQFLSGKKCLFDLYVKLQSNRYIKILKTGEDFSRERLKNYTDKGVQEFYFHRRNQEDLLAYNAKLNKALMKSKKIPNDVKIKQFFSSGEQTLQFLKKAGVKENELKYAETYLVSVLDVVDTFNLPKHKEHLKMVLENAGNFDHALITTLIASLVAKALHFEAEKSLKIVGLAALLHDVGLYTLPEHFWDEDISKLGENDFTLFHQHPIIGSEILNSIKGIDPMTCFAVAQHHLRRDGKGFPSKLTSAKISVPGEIVGISNEFSCLLGKAKREPQWATDIKLDLHVLNGFSSETISAFQSVFATPPPNKKKL